MPDEKIEAVKGLSLTADEMGAVFDVPADDVDAFIEGMPNLLFRKSLISMLLVLLNHWYELKIETFPD